ncbi:MAG: hypothetical protein CBB60_006105 [Armatimonadetes bacterium Cent15-Ar3]|nr:MAG: hypothetical protein CBB60_006105 [Armatimonadetes bacterium Cent15-Ar3]
MLSQTVTRTCVSCRSKRDQASLIRLGVSTSGDLQYWGGSGRSAYLCPSTICLEGALKPGRLTKALRSAVSATSLATIKQEIACKLELSQ